MNMGYCRFQNTLEDLKDCLDHLTDKLSTEEHRARITLLFSRMQAMKLTRDEFYV